MVQAVILFGHGSRDPLWRVPIEAVAARLRNQHPEALVRCAYLELDTPDLATAAGEVIDLGAGAVTILPMFLGTGRHAREDVPRLVDELRTSYPTVAFRLRKPIGEEERVLELITKIAAE